MKNIIIATIFIFIGSIVAASAATTTNTVTIVYNGTSATVTMTNDISSYVTVTSGTSSHVKIVQSDKVDDTVGEIFYNLSGATSDGEFYLEGSYKCTLTLSGVSITNPSGPAINIQNGKRVEVSVKNSTTSYLVDGVNETYNGAYHCKGHTKFKGKGTLNVTGNSKHAIYSKEYLEIKNCTINVVSAVKDGIHCREYFLMESGELNISSVGDDGIQVELDGQTSTGTTVDHEEEDSGNIYITGGTITMTSIESKCLKADGTISITGGTQNFDTTNISENNASAIDEIFMSNSADRKIYDISGRRVENITQPGIYIIRQNGVTRKIAVR